MITPFFKIIFVVVVAFLAKDYHNRQTLNVRRFLNTVKNYLADVSSVGSVEQMTNISSNNSSRCLTYTSTFG